MEGSKGEAVFDSMNLNPQLFINATLNTVDDVVDQAFDFYTLSASNIFKMEGLSDNYRSQELSKRWEDYCLRYTFAVPDDFVLPETHNAFHESSHI